MPPFRMPEAPEPAMARPMMNIVELVDTPHINDPNSKTARKERNVF